MGSSSARRTSLLLAASLVACSSGGAPYGYQTISVIRARPGAGAVVSIEGTQCPRAEEWDVLTWPEMEPVAASFGPTETSGSIACFMPITPDEPFTERWYVARWSGERMPSDYPSGAVQLRDGSWVWRFRGVVPAFVSGIEINPVSDRVFVEADVSSAAIDPAPGYDWASLMSVTQGSIACAYPGASVEVDGESIGFFEQVVVACVGIDWSAPVHIHVEGAVTRDGSHVPMPIVDVDHTFVFTDEPVYFELVDRHDEPAPACLDSRCE